MAKIRILPENLANQIAAGEVIERPASVVKEIVENSLDAGADRVEVDIEGGGTRLIRVVDNGCGMDEDDLLLCLERHGTSKIGAVEDLGAITTLGFRGEAIPSIGSVAKLSIVSRPTHADFATKVELEYGRLLKVHQVGSPVGTHCEVRNLFGNTPARRKFLRSLRTELGHIEEVVKNFALTAGGVTFILRIDGREVLALGLDQPLEHRLASLLRHTGSFIVVNKKDHCRRVEGLLLPPETQGVGNIGLRIAVNNRVVRDRVIAHGATEGMRSFLMKGRMPIGLLRLTLPAEEVDVNVHPAKHEVRFRSSREVHELVREAVLEAMAGYQHSLRLTIFGEGRRAEPSAIPSASRSASQALPALHSDDNRRNPDPPLPISPALRDRSPAQAATAAPPLYLLQSAEPLPQRERATDPSPTAISPRQEEAPRRRHQLLVIGQFDNLYIFCRSGEELLVIDQHAAHERLLFEKLRRQFQASAVARQTLMFPLTVQLSLLQSRLAEENAAVIDRLGFTIRDFGGNTYVIAAVPALAGQGDPAALFFDLLEQFGGATIGEAGGGLETLFASLACKAAVKAGTALSPAEIDKLLDDMTAADLFSHCPHGRPVVKRFTGNDIKRWFFRG
jgi:DNA mismatch repair protein MutL